MSYENPERLIRRLLAAKTPEQALPLLGRPDVLDMIARHTGPGATIVLPELDHMIEVDKQGQPRLVCMKCAMATTPGVPVARYRHQFTRPTYIVEWDNALAWELVRRSGRKPKPIDRSWLRTWIEGGTSSLTPGHIDHIPPEHLDDPILCDVIRKTAYRDGTGEPVLVPWPVLIDGHHRAARGLRDNRPVLGYVLDTYESMAVQSIAKDEYDPELMGWLSREQAEALPMEPMVVPQ